MDYNITNGRDRAARDKAQALLESLHNTGSDADTPPDAPTSTPSAADDSGTTPNQGPGTAETTADTPSWSAGMIPTDVDFTQDAFTEGVLVPVTQEPSTWRTTDPQSTPPEPPSVTTGNRDSGRDSAADEANPPQAGGEGGHEQLGWAPNTGGQYNPPPAYQPPQHGYPAPAQHGAPQNGQHASAPQSYPAHPGYPQWVHGLHPSTPPQQQRPTPAAYAPPGYPPQPLPAPGQHGIHQPDQQNYYSYPPPAAPAPAPSIGFTPDTAAGAPSADDDDTPVSGWRSIVRRMGLRVKESPDEQLWRTMVRTINRPLREPKVIGVTAPKGGVAKTTVLSMMAVVTARLRPACRIVAVDTDHNGGLALRAEGRQPSNILEFAKAIQRGDSDRPNFMAHTVDGVDILGSSPSLVDPPVTPEMWQTVLDELKNRYDLIFVDMSIMQATETYAAVLQSLDGLIIVATPAVEATRPLGEIPRWLDLNKATHLKSRRTTVFTKIDTEPDEVDVAKMIKHEHDNGIEAAAVPFDPHLRSATNLTFDEVATETKKAFVTVAASAIKNVS